MLKPQGMKSVVPIAFQGVITDVNDLSPAFGGKPFTFEITLDSGEKVFILDDASYLDMRPQRRSPATRAFTETSGNRGDEVSGEYVIWNKRNVVITLTDF